MHQKRPDSLLACLPFDEVQGEQAAGQGAEPDKSLVSPLHPDGQGREYPIPQGQAAQSLFLPIRIFGKTL